jgi:hypothetical protein
MIVRALIFLCLALFTATPRATALIVPFTEGFTSGASNWLNGASAAPTWSDSGGADDGAYISYTSPDFTSGGSSPFPPFPPPFQLMFRANSNTNASGGAFVGNWLAGGVSSLSVTARHNYGSTLHLSSRLASTGGAGASLAFDTAFAMAPNTWTTINIPIVQSDPPFVGYGSGTFSSTFSNIQNLQFGLYLPANTQFTGLRMDIANASMVPEPGAAELVLSALAVLALLRHRHRMSFHKR